MVENIGVSHGLERCRDISRFGESALRIFTRHNLLNVVCEFLSDLLGGRNSDFAVQIFTNRIILVPIKPDTLAIWAPIDYQYRIGQN